MNEADTATKSNERVRAAGPRSGLFRKYVVLFSTLISAVLLVSGLVEIYFSYQETKSALLDTQREKAKAAAAVIEQFVKGVEKQVRWTMHPTFVPSTEALEQRRTDYFQLLRQAPAVSEVAYIDPSGREQILVSRLALDVIGSGKDYENDPKFGTSRAEGRYLSQVYFRKGSEPYLTLGIGGRGRDKGVTVVEVNLKFIWEVISRIKVGRAGRAFVVDSRKLLIAHPDISLVLRKTDLSGSPQVKFALVGSDAIDSADVGTITRSLDGRQVLSAHAAIMPLRWLVFVELPLSEAFAPLYDSLVRTAILLLVGIVVSVLAALLLTRRIVKPIQALQLGAAQIGAGALDHRIDVRTGDELEVLAEDFNQMTIKLQESYEKVERLSALKRYFSPHLAELIVSSKEADLTEDHRREITVVFCDIRNFTEFSSISEPEEAMRVLREYYKSLGAHLRPFEATISHFAGDGLMAYFNDPLPCPDPAARAVRMSVAMQESVGELIKSWRMRGIDLGFGIGVALGYATLGHIGSEDQFHYTAIGSVANLASRLCDEAKHGEILISEAVLDEVNDLVEVKALGARSLKGFPKPMPIFRVVSLKHRAEETTS